MSALALDIFGPHFQMWITYIIIIAALIAYAIEDIPVELTSIGHLGLYHGGLSYFPRHR